jgi:hypothetical protein
VSLNVHHRRAVTVLSAAVLLDVALGLTFGAVARVGAFEGIFYATGVATTDGADITPHGTLQHALTLGMMSTILPLFAACLALVTTGLTADHLDGKGAAGEP